MIIFTGTGRSGTALYSKLFGTFHEFNVASLTKHFRLQDFTSDPFADPGHRLSIIKEHLKDVDISSFRDSSNPYVHFLDSLYALDHNIKIVLGVRDGRDFVISGITRGYHDENKYRSFSMQPTADDPYYEKWGTMTPIERCAWMWVFRNQKAIDRLGSVPESNKRLIRLEDLTNKNTLKSLENFLCMKSKKRYLKIKVNKNKYLKYPPKEEWTTEMNNRFNKVAGKMMEKLGYYASSQ